jgi:hypothetical protein
MHVTMLKKMIINDTSRNPSPYTAVPRAPVGNLRFYQRMRSSVGWVMPPTHGRIHNRHVKNTVKRLLCCVWVLCSMGTGRTPFSSTPASSTPLYHLETTPAFAFPAVETLALSPFSVLFLECSDKWSPWLASKSLSTAIAMLIISSAKPKVCWTCKEGCKSLVKLNLL